MDKDEKKLYYVKGIPVPETPDIQITSEAWGKTTVVGRPLPRVDAYERVSGTAIYASDLTMPLPGAVMTLRKKVMRYP